MMSKTIWIPKAIKSKSELRKTLHVPEGRPISVTTLEQIKHKEPGDRVISHGKSVKVTKHLKKSATLAMTLKTFQRKQKRGGM